MPQGQPLEDHRRIVEATASGDPTVAQARLWEHLSGALGQVDKIGARCRGCVAE